jgi:hypothetical protein
MDNRESNSFGFLLLVMNRETNASANCVVSYYIRAQKPNPLYF